jgi:hypothetical protein
MLNQGVEEGRERSRRDNIPCSFWCFNFSPSGDFDFFLPSSNEDLFVFLQHTCMADDCLMATRSSK